MNPYEILGINQSATQNEIKSAYKYKAQKTHPDRNGGNDSEFKKIKEAYEILSNIKSKEQYDKYGYVDKDTLSIEEEARGELIALLDSLLIPRNLERNIIKLAHNKICDLISSIENEINKFQNEKSELEKYLKNRFSTSDEQNICVDIVSSKISNINNIIEEGYKALKRSKLMEEYLLVYSDSKIEEDNSPIFNFDKNTFINNNWT